ncbi:MAG: hypothetical protein WC451_00905 [Patescibacteria group bacterium]
MKDGENLRGFTSDFGAEFFIEQAKYWNLHILKKIVARNADDIESEYYSSMEKAVNTIAGKFKPPYYNPYKHWFPYYEVVLTLEEIELLKGVIGDNHAFLMRKIEQKKTLGSFMDSKAEEKELQNIERWVTSIAPSMSDSIGKRFFKPFEETHRESKIIMENKSITDEYNYVDPKRIDDVSQIKNEEFDQTKLIALLNELNIASKNGCYLSVTYLLRAIIDHVPPIFDCKTFSEVANNHVGKSIKDLFERLDKSSRNLADLYLHDQIKKKESMPNATQVNYTNELDLLLGEIVKKLSK